MTTQAQTPIVKPDVNWELFRLKLENIKPFDGNSNTLNKFIKRCDDLVTKYKSFNNEDINTHVFESIAERLTGRAEAMIGNRVELDSWDKLKMALIQCFSDRRDLDCLVQELTRTKPYKGENILNFGNRLQLLRSSVVQRVSNGTLDEQEKLCHIGYYEKTALNTFIAGCTGTLKNNMYLKKPTSLEDAMAFVNEFENFEKLYNNFGDMPKINKNNFSTPRPTQFQNFQNQNHQQTYRSSNPPIQYFPNEQTYMPSNMPNQNFPSQPINIQPRMPMTPQRYPTNRQVFGRPQNVFRPNQIPQNQLPRPIPMSTTSRNPTINSNQRSNHFRNQYPNQKPNFQFQELYFNEHEINNTTQEYNDPQENFSGYDTDYCYDPRQGQDYENQFLNPDQYGNTNEQPAIAHDQLFSNNQNQKMDNDDNTQNFLETGHPEQQT